MKALASTLAVMLIVAGGTSAQAKNSSNSSGNSNGKQAQILKSGLDAMVASSSGGPPPKTVDNDQGDDHASDRAKDVVCNKDTPAARRSAICPVPVSP